MIFEELRIRNVRIRPAQILAPMAGITDTVFRRFIRRLGGCGLIMTEFVSSEGMLRQNLKSQRFLYYTEEERPITAQIFGADPERLAEAARMIEDLGFDIIDLNLGCPAKKVVKCGGSGLLRDLPLLGSIFRKSAPRSASLLRPRFASAGATRKSWRRRWRASPRTAASRPSPST